MYFKINLAFFLDLYMRSFIYIFVSVFPYRLAYGFDSETQFWFIFLVENVIA